MKNGCLLDPDEFEVELSVYGEEEDKVYCEKLKEKWSPELEKEMLDAFVRFYYDAMYEQWGPDDPEESKAYWPEFSTGEELLNYIGKDVTVYAEEDGIYAASESGDPPYESQNVPYCVVLSLNCPWDEELGWAAVFVDEKFIKIQEDVISGIYVDEDELKKIFSE